jgi:phosphatidate cytidylyltransferase
MINLEISKRLISSFILIPSFTYIVLFEPFILKISLFILLILALIEWLKMVHNFFLKIFGCIFIFFSFYCSFFIINFKSELFFYLILVICIATDVGGYIFGKIFKGPRLTKISPNKTYSGALGSFFLPMIFFSILSYSKFFYLLDFNFNLGIIFCLSLISQIGDLIISYFKRLYNIKDTGKIIPGHGGILDRIDGMLFVFPFIFLTIKLDFLLF